MSIARGLLQTRMNLEMAVTEEMLAIAEGFNRPMSVQSREELTTEGGLDVAYWRSPIEQLASA